MRQIFKFLWQNVHIFVAKFGKIWDFKWQFSTMPALCVKWVIAVIVVVVVVSFFMQPSQMCKFVFFCFFFVFDFFPNSLN